MIHAEIKQALETLGKPVAFHTYKGKSTTYITYFSYDEGASFHASNREMATDFYFQINVFSKENYADIVAGVIEQMNKLGGKRLNGTEFYENDTYQKSMRFRFTRKTN